MPLTFQSKLIDDVVVIRCRGRISFGAEVNALEAEVEQQTKVPGTNILSAHWVVLDLAETDYIDSSGLGALVRLLAVLRAAGGGLKLCQLSPQVRKVIEITNLVSLFPIYESEDQAIDAFSIASRSPTDRLGRSQTTIVCVDTSSDLLAALNALLTSSGYHTLYRGCRNPGESHQAQSSDLWPRNDGQPGWSSGAR